MRCAPLLALLAACTHATAPAPAPTVAAKPELVFEVTPVQLGTHTPGELPPVTVTLVNQSSRAYTLPQPGPWAVAMPGALHYEYERKQPDGTWEPMARSYVMPIDRYPGEDPETTFTIAPGARVVLPAGRGLPPLTFSDEVFGTLRARLVYDVDAEFARRKVTAAHVDPIVSNYIELDQIDGPLEVTLDVIGKIAVGQPVDLPNVLRVTVRNRSDRDVTILGPGADSGVAFDIDKPNGGTWPKGDRPEMGNVDAAGTPRALHPGETVEVYGPHAALGAMPISAPWIYPVAEAFRLRANFYQPTPQRFHYSAWVPVVARP